MSELGKVVLSSGPPASPLLDQAGNPIAPAPAAPVVVCPSPVPGTSYANPEALPPVEYPPAGSPAARPPDGPEINWRGQRVAIRPPNVRQLPVPEVPRPIEMFLWSKVFDEAILADLCIERAYQIIERRTGEKRVGIDHFPGSGGSGSADPASVMAAAAQLGVELFRRIAPKLEGEYRESYEKVVQSAITPAV